MHSELLQPTYRVLGSHFLPSPGAAGMGDLTLPVFAVSASVSFQEFFSASGFCSSAVLLWCCDFPASLLYVEELLSCLLEDICFSILARQKARCLLHRDTNSASSTAAASVILATIPLLTSSGQQLPLLPSFPQPTLNPSCWLSLISRSK